MVTLPLREPVVGDSLRGREVFVTVRREGRIEFTPRIVLQDPRIDEETGRSVIDLKVGDYGRAETVSTKSVVFCPVPIAVPADAGERAAF